MGGQLRLAFVSISTPLSKASWSGIPWYSLNEIRRRFPDTHVVDTPRIDTVVNRLGPAERLGIYVRRHPVTSYLCARSINAQLEALQPDAVIGVSAAHKLAYIDPKWPLIYATDALFATVIDYYEKYARMPRRVRARGNMVQSALLGHTDRVLMASDWAAESARAAYRLPPEQVATARMGANLDHDPGYVPPAPDRPLTLLFIGYTWERKGGPLVLDIWRKLRARTGTAELHIAGIRPPEAEGLDGVHLYGRIDKSDPAQYARFKRMYQDASFFIMPSRQEAYGIVYCEAAAFGRPAVATDTGGVGSIIDDGTTGLLLPLSAGAEAYADRIVAVWRDRDRHAAMCVAARARFEHQLNWQSWGDCVERAVHVVLASGTHKRPRPLMPESMSS